MLKNLHEIKVIDASHAVAGPTAGMILADMGANVIKLEHPHGDHFRPLLGGAYYAAVNRNKRGISVDLKHPQGRAVAEKLVEDADVLLESFTPGTMDKLGLGYETLKKINPRIIYCSISGFGQDGPYHRLPGYDVVAQAMCGIMMCTGMPDGPPVRIGASWIDMGSGMYAVIGILKALLDREQTGSGTHIDISLLDTALSWMSPLVAHFSMSGELPARNGSALGAFSPYQVFRCKDGYVFIGASTDRFWRALCRILDLEHLIEDPRFATNADRVANRRTLTELIEAGLVGVARDTLVEKLRQAGLPCGPVFDVGQIVQDPHVDYREVLLTWEHPEFGKVTQVKTPIRQMDKMPEIRTPSPFLGQHTVEVLAELGYNRSDIDALLRNGAAIAAKPVTVDSDSEGR